MTYLFLHPIMHLLLFLSPDWLTFCHVIISHINSLGFLFIFCFSDEGPMLETLDHTIRIGSTPTFLYFDCISTLPTKHTTFMIESDSFQVLTLRCRFIMEVTIYNSCIFPHCHIHWKCVQDMYRQIVPLYPIELETMQSFILML